tara:strand:+ start:112 stop:276 length:165 start_codon:yes stop_codon:yes gene_type:complete
MGRNCPLIKTDTTEFEIMAITGHQTSKKVTRYIKAASQKVRAQAASQKMRAAQS